MKDSLLRLVNAKTSLARFVEIFAEIISFARDNLAKYFTM